jgi:hypothetical protein
MNDLQRIWLIPLLFLLALAAAPASAADDDDEWAPTPPRLSFIDGEVSYWRQGADEWARARLNLALAEGDAFYTGTGANFEVQFGSRSFVRADEATQLSLVQQEANRIQFRLTGGRVSFDMRSLAVPREPAAVRSQTTAREPVTARPEAKPVTRPAQPSGAAPPAPRPAVPGSVQAPRPRPEVQPQRGEVRQDEKERPLPGAPASRTYRGRDRDSREAR